MKRIFRPIGVAATFAIGAILLSGTAQAQGFTGPAATCNGTGGNHSFGPLLNDVWLMSIGPQPNAVTRALAAPISPGTYDLTTVSWDGAQDRVTHPVQPHETYYMELLDAAGNVLAASGVTGDLADGVLEAEWSGSIGQVTWSGADATQVRVLHSHRGYPDWQSVHATCFGWSPVPVNTTTTTTTTTTKPADPTTTTTTTTTTAQVVPTVVLPAVEEAQAPDPVQGTPTFTG